MKTIVGFFFVVFFFTFFLSYPSTHLNLFVRAVSHSAGGFRSALFYRCGWLTGGHGAAGRGGAWLRDLMLCDRLATQSDSLYAAVVTLFEAALFSCAEAVQQARRRRRLLFDVVFI